MSRLFELLLLAVSIGVVLVPSIGAISSSGAARRQQLAGYSFDGHRYVLGRSEEQAVGQRLDFAEELSQVLSALASADAKTGTEASTQFVVQEWRAAAREQGFEATLVEAANVTSLIGRTVDQVVVGVMVKAGSAYPSQLLDADSIFVTAFEPDVGTVLYRRRAFDELWSGIALLFDGPPIGGP